MLAGTPPAVRRTLEQGALVELIGEENFFWSSDQAIVAAEQRDCAHCEPHPPAPSPEIKSPISGEGKRPQ
jgi:hypothetical protein